MVFYLIMKVQEEEKLCNQKNYKIFSKKKLGSKEILYLGNLNAKRDWGHAKDYTEMQWRILQQKNLMILLLLLVCIFSKTVCRNCIKLSWFKNLLARQGIK